MGRVVREPPGTEVFPQTPIEAAPADYEPTAPAALLSAAPRTLSPLEQAAISYVYARRDFDGAGYFAQDKVFSKTLHLAWCRLEAAAKDAEKETNE